MQISVASPKTTQFEFPSSFSNKINTKAFGAYLEKMLTPDTVQASNESTSLEEDLKKLLDPPDLYGAPITNIPNGGYLMPASHPGNKIYVSDIAAKTEQGKAVFQKHFNQILAQNNIDTSKEITLSTDTNGKIIVTNDHPDKQKIEQIFQENANLHELYAEIMSNEFTIREARLAEAYQNDFRLDPNLANLKYADLLDPKRKTIFSLNIKDGNFRISFKEQHQTT